VRTDGTTLILGLGETGAAAAKWCGLHGARLRVLDTRAEPGGMSALKAALGGSQVEYLLGAEHFARTALQGVHTIVLSPGLVPSEPPQRELLRGRRSRASKSLAKSNYLPVRWLIWRRRGTSRRCLR